MAVALEWRGRASARRSLSSHPVTRERTSTKLASTSSKQRPPRSRATQFTRRPPSSTLRSGRLGRHGAHKSFAEDGESLRRSSRYRLVQDSARSDTRGVRTPERPLRAASLACARALCPRRAPAACGAIPRRRRAEAARAGGIAAAFCAKDVRGSACAGRARAPTGSLLRGAPSRRRARATRSATGHPDLREPEPAPLRCSEPTISVSATATKVPSSVRSRRAPRCRRAGSVAIPSRSSATPAKTGPRAGGDRRRARADLERRSGTCKSSHARVQKSVLWPARPVSKL